MKLKNIAVAIALPLTLALACGGKSSEKKSSSPDSSAKGKGQACQDFCEQAEGCGTTTVQACVESCTENSVTSRAGQEVLAECFDDALCDEATEAEGVQALACILSGLDGVELSATAKKYCGESVDKINACLENEPEQPFGTCESTIGIVSDEFLAGLNACAEKSCAEVEWCIQLELLKNLPLDELLSLEEGEEPSPGILATLVSLGVALGQLGLSDETGGDFGDLFPEPDNMGGGSNR
jgi:hypothetical protein